MNTLTDIRGNRVTKGCKVVTGYREDRPEKKYDKDSLEIVSVDRIDYFNNTFWTTSGILVELEDTDVLVVPDEW